jgi:dihydropyrimidine dehydrogenase (NAD+) subunit PreT
MGVPPIQIGKLQRYATDVAFAEGWRFFEAGADTGKSVALVGAGPASWRAPTSCGASATRARSTTSAGGRRPQHHRRRALQDEGRPRVDEVEWVLGIGGIEVQTGVEIGESRPDASPSSRSEHDAVFLGLGLGPDTPLGVPGEELPGVTARSTSSSDEARQGSSSVACVKRCVVVGGGNTALDAVRELRGPRRPRGDDGLPRHRGEDERLRPRVEGGKVEGVPARVAGAAGRFEGAGR